MRAAGTQWRLAVVLSHPTQYYSPWFRHLAREPGLALRVFYLWDFGVTEKVDPQFGKSFAWDVDLLSGYESEFVPNASGNPGPENFLGFRNPGLTRRIGAWGPDAVLLFGYKYASHLAVVAWARTRGVPLLFRGDSHFIGRPSPGLGVRLALRTLYSQFGGFLYVGSANRDYFRTLGVPEERLFFCPHCVDGARFDRGASGVAEEALRLRASLGIGPRSRVVLFAGKLIPAKQPYELLESFTEIQAPDSYLVFVGDGSERGRLGERATGPGGASVRFLPFANQSQMPARLRMADVFALPSRGLYETWGLAVNEAMHMGVPCLVSDRVGCQRDLVSDGETGWVFEATDPGALRAALRRALASMARPEEAARLASAALARVAGYSFAEASKGLIRALATTVG